MLQILSLLKAVSILLAVVASGNVSADLRDQAIQLANQAIGVAQQQMVQLTTTSMTESTTTPDTQTPVAPSVVTAPSVTATPASQARIEIFSTQRNSRIEDPHVNVGDGTPDDPANKLDVGATVYDDNGNLVTAGNITITTSDPNQDTTTFSRNVNGQIYFPYEYIFRFAGDHTITFSMNGASNKITVHSN